MVEAVGARRVQAEDGLRFTQFELVDHCCRNIVRYAGSFGCIEQIQKILDIQRTHGLFWFGRHALVLSHALEAISTKGRAASRAGDFEVSIAPPAGASGGTWPSTSRATSAKSRCCWEAFRNQEALRPPSRQRDCPIEGATSKDLKRRCESTLATRGSERTSDIGVPANRKPAGRHTGRKMRRRHRSNGQRDADPANGSKIRFPHRRS